jgi:hypothetical protein
VCSEPSQLTNKLCKYGKHVDAKPGLVNNVKPGLGCFKMIVPTLGIHNHSDQTTHISWYELD